MASVIHLVCCMGGGVRPFVGWWLGTLVSPRAIKQEKLHLFKVRGHLPYNNQALIDCRYYP